MMPIESAHIAPAHGPDNPFAYARPVVATNDLRTSDPKVRPLGRT